MVLDEETYDLIDEYLQSAVEVMKQMYREHGEEIFTKDFEEYFDDFRDRTYELTEVITDEHLEGFKDFYIEKLTEALHGEITPMAIAKKDHSGQLEYDLRILDTSINLHKRGRNVDWGSNTPREIKSIINKIVMRG
ncbi:hypothetical protein SRABI84_02067 [Peribacillus simplex]|uniref:hypothetical protein n=1 Tax=Peribacillus simplex TaxID=1478 RepID=UPI001D87D70F|nr:hypothetical protein [Peribacillus simplex]CAH0208024.1 hypothetical protein SRABI84_02067 [Peribacillus simplex]